jgi:hypothetical protein
MRHFALKFVLFLDVEGKLTGMLKGSDEESDNDRKFREEQLIASMEDQIYNKSNDSASQLSPSTQK